MLEAVHLSRRYGDFVAVDDVSFSIDPGEVVGLLGHNGAGKTTIMKMLTAYLEPSAGQVRIDGWDVIADPEAAHRLIGYLPESLPVYPELTVADYLAYVARLRGLDPAAVVPPAVRATDLQGRLLDPIATLSRGFRQRVGVAQAILHKPRFLILDEPTNGLDPSQTQHMRTLIRQLAEQATVILSTHIMQEVKAVCDRALILRQGKLVVDERLADLVHTSALRVRASGVDVSSVLTGLAAVKQKTADDGAWLVEVSGSVEDGVASIAKALVSAGADIREIAPVQQDLEMVFRRVNEEVAA
ncbi:MAG: ABC transporter ATP-binding protein [Gammaproteobacteria bacterium]|nr:ABC transporter ATP-binding protein [Gammaproteobacteria bacterium]